MADVGKYTGVATANIGKVMGVAAASIGKIDGVTYPHAAVATATYGYYIGGYTGGRTATVDRLTYSTSTVNASTTYNLSQARWGMVGVSDKVTYGYSCGGGTGAYVATTDQMTFSTSASAAKTGANLSSSRGDGQGGVSDGSLYGYALGGATGSNASSLVADRITFSAGTTAAKTGANLTEIKRDVGSGVSDVTNGYGYIAGGRSATSTVSTEVDKITFSTSATAAHTSSLAVGTDCCMGISDGIFTNGYLAGGRTTGATAVVNKIVFSTGTVSALTTPALTRTRSNNGANCSDGGASGYFVAGDDSVNSADKMVYSTATIAAQTTANSSITRRYVTGMSDFAV